MTSVVAGRGRKHVHLIITLLDNHYPISDICSKHPPHASYQPQLMQVQYHNAYGVKATSDMRSENLRFSQSSIFAQNYIKKATLHLLHALV